MAIDGTSHMISDLAGIGSGFRDSNNWLAGLTNNQFSSAFYAGDAWGSFNAWMRLISGALFGLGLVWFGFPYLDESFLSSAAVVKHKINNQIRYYREKQNLLSQIPTATGPSQYNNMRLKSEQGGEHGS